MATLLSALTRQFLAAVDVVVQELLEKSAGQEVVGGVEGRPADEDMEVGVDRICDDIFQGLLWEYQRNHGLRVRVYSEHGVYGPLDPHYLCAIDPFDGSGLWRRGLRRELFSVLSFFNLDGTPLTGGCVDFLARQMYLAEPGNTIRVSLVTNGVPHAVAPSGMKELGDETVIAAYLMNTAYREEWQERTKNLFRCFPGVLVWPNGGSCIYPLIATGQVHAYLMFREPRSEIDPGLGFTAGNADNLGFPVYSVSRDGALTPYLFVPGRGEERVPFFITACTSQLAQEIVAEILRDN